MARGRIFGALGARAFPRGRPAGRRGGGGVCPGLGGTVVAFAPHVYTNAPPTASHKRGAEVWAEGWAEEEGKGGVRI